VTVTLTILFLMWVAINVAAPHAAFLRAERISAGRLPAELLTHDRDRKVRFYMMTLTRGYGFSIWAIPFNVVVFDREFFRHATPPMIRFVIAHELAHFHLNHHKKKWVCRVTGAIFLPFVKRWLERMENQADEEAETRTGIPRAIIGGH
jgi:Zn-dependent protease with chaperone function